MSAQHTPGPWLVNPFKAWVEVPDADAPICAMLWPTDLRSEDETFANARLIAAAPDLLAAVQRFLDYESAMDSREDVSGMLIYAEFSDMARAAIAKATGKTK